MNRTALKQIVRTGKKECYIANLGSSLERLRKVRALNCETDYIGIDSLVMKMLPFSRPAGLY